MADTQLLFLPVQSKLHPDFTGIYFAYPTTRNGSVVNFKFTSVKQLLEKAPELENFTKSTIFCNNINGGLNADIIRAVGFEHAYNNNDFTDDTWIVNGIEFAMDGRDILLGKYQKGGITYTWYVSNAYYSRTAGGDLLVPQDLSGETNYTYNIWYDFPFNGQIYLRAERRGVFAPIIFQDIWNGVLPGETDSPTTLPTTPIIPFEGAIKVYKNIILMNGAKIINGEEGTTESGIKVYKDINMMNGAKMLNEDGTEYKTSEN